MDLELIKAVVCVWRTKSVSAAARQLHLSQGAVSTRLQNAEAAVGRPLFIRHARGVDPTAACDSFVREVAPHVDAIAHAWSAVQGREDASVVVHLGGPAAFLAELALPKLASVAPLSVRFGLPAEVLSGVSSGTLDLAVCTVRPRARAGLVERLFEEQLLWVGDRVSWEDGRWLAYADGLPLIRRYARATGRALPKPTVVVPDLRALRKIVRESGGMTILPHYLVCDDLEVLEDVSRPITNTLWLVVGRRRAQLAPVQHVVAALRALASQ